MPRPTPTDRLHRIGETAGHDVYRDGCRGTYHAWYGEGTEESVSTMVVLVASTVQETDPGDLDPLASTVDPGALDALVDDWRRNDASPAAGSVRFPFSGCVVTVHASGEIVVETRDREVSP